MDRNLPANEGDTGLIPDLGRSHMWQSKNRWHLQKCTTTPEACALGSGSHSHLKPEYLEPVLRDAPQLEQPLLTASRESLDTAMETQHSYK